MSVVLSVVLSYVSVVSEVEKTTDMDRSPIIHVPLAHRTLHKVATRKRLVEPEEQ